MTDYTIETITAGETWACRFKIKTWLDKDGNPVAVKNLQPGEPVKGAKPGDWESLGLIQKRDVNSQLVELQDTVVDRTWVVPFHDCWAIDRAELAD